MKNTKNSLKKLDRGTKVKKAVPSCNCPGAEKWGKKLESPRSNWYEVEVVDGACIHCLYHACYRVAGKRYNIVRDNVHHETEFDNIYLPKDSILNAVSGLGEDWLNPERRKQVSAKTRRLHAKKDRSSKQAVK